MDVNDVKEIRMIKAHDFIVIGFFSCPQITVMVW